MLLAAAAETELVSTELPANETPVLAAFSSAGSRDIEEIAPLHIDFAGLAQLLVHMDPANDSFVAINRQWRSARAGALELFYHVPGRCVAVNKTPVRWNGVACHGR